MAYAESTLRLFAGGRPSLFTNRICFGDGSTTVAIEVVGALSGPVSLPISVSVSLDHRLILHLETLLSEEILWICTAAWAIGELRTFFSLSKRRVLGFLSGFDGTAGVGRGFLSR